MLPNSFTNEDLLKIFDQIEKWLLLEKGISYKFSEHQINSAQLALCHALRSYIFLIEVDKNFLKFVLKPMHIVSESYVKTASSNIESWDSEFTDGLREVIQRSFN